MSRRYRGAVPSIGRYRALRHPRTGLATAAACVMMGFFVSRGQTAGNESHSRSPASCASSSKALPKALPRARSAILDIGVSAFPYDGTVPDTGTHFLSDDGQFHDSPRGGRLLAAKTYSDSRSLLFIPSRFNPSEAAALVLFLHGNLATLSHDVVRRQNVPEQVEASKANVVLVAPQLAVDALDSSAGHFWEPGFLDAYLRCAAKHLAALSDGRVRADDIESLPVILVAYSGGYLPTAFSLEYSRAPGRRRIAGVVLLDALFGEEPKFADWIIATRAQSFFVSAYSRSSADLNAKLEGELEALDIPILSSLPAHIVPGDVVFQPALGAVHNDFMTQAFTHDPLRSVLSRIDLARIAHGTAAGEEARRLESLPTGNEGPAGSPRPIVAPGCRAATPRVK